MTRQELKQFSKRQNQACGIINHLQHEGKINQNQATDYTGQVLFDMGLTPEYLEVIFKELLSKLGA